MMRASRTKPMTFGKPPFSPVKEMSPRSNPSSPAAASPKKFHQVSLGSGSPPLEAEDRWEVRPGGMLVQRRDPDAADTVAKPLPPPIKVRVKYGAVYHEVFINPEASFGELKKLLSVQTGLHPLEQKVMYKDKERDSAAFLDTSGVKDRSKLVLLEDANAKAKRFLEMRKNAKMEKAAKAVAAITHDVDRLAKQVSLVESIVGRGKKVADNDVVGLIDQLMNQLLKLDSVAVVDGEDSVKQQKKTQILRVQKYVEALDVIKVKNSSAESPRTPLPPPQQKPQPQPQQQQHYPQQKQQPQHQHYPQQNSRNPYLDHLSSPTVKHPNPQPLQLQLQKPLSPASSQLDLLSSPTWEPFDLLSSGPSTSHSISSPTTTPTASSTPTSAVHAAPATAFASPVSPVPVARFEWELF